MPRCSLCGYPVLRIGRGIFGLRCVRCFSTFIHRAVGVVLSTLSLGPESSVYELSSRGSLFRHLQKRFSNLTSSEYFADLQPGAFRGRTQCQDVQRLTYSDSRFDLITSTEVFEHVPDDRKGFSEIARVLRPGGHFVFTVPLSARAETRERARIEDGRVVYLLPPEYHGDPLRPFRKVLAFRNYGLDIADRLEAAGLRTEIRAVDVPRFAIRNAPVLVCRKAAAPGSDNAALPASPT